MDFQEKTLLLAMFAALCAAFTSGWLLYTMVDTEVLCLVIVADLISCPIGLFVPWACHRRRRWGTSSPPTTNIFTASGISILCSGIVVAIDLTAVQGQPASILFSETSFRILIAIAGIGMATSLIIYLVQYTMVKEAAEIRRLQRKVQKTLHRLPQPRLVLVDDLAEAPGEGAECPICLELLTDLPPEVSVAPQRGICGARPSLLGKGLMQLPCKHTFHGPCVERWMAQEVSCPCCRTRVPSMAKCVCICVRHRNVHTSSSLGGGKRPSSGQDQKVLEEDADVEPGRARPTPAPERGRARVPSPPSVFLPGRAASPGVTASGGHNQRDWGEDQARLDQAVRAYISSESGEPGGGEDQEDRLARAVRAYISSEASGQDPLE